MLSFVYLLVALGLGGGRLSSQEPPKPDSSAPYQPGEQPAAAKAEEAPKQEEPKEEEFKEEPTTLADKMSKEELEKKACPVVDVKFSTDTDKTKHPTPGPSPDKALLYVVRPTMKGNKIQTKLAVDGQWVGVNRGHNYFFLELDPGDHYFCSKAENRSVAAFKLEAGKTYYLEQKIKVGLMKARNRLAMLPDEEGKKKLAECHPSSWLEKK